MFWKPIFESRKGWEYYRNVLFSEDTLINNISYHKLFTSSKHEITRITSTYTGGIREDSVKKVWIKFDTSLSIINTSANEYGEFLLYDFNLAVGDSFLSFGLSLNHNIVYVCEIDTIIVNNTKRKKFLFGNDIQIIEGIGNTQGLFICSPAWPTNGMHNDLVCCHQNDTLLYYNSYYDDCVPSFVLNDVPILPNPDIKVYPNPVTDNQVNFENLDFESLELYNEKGCMVFEADLTGYKNYTLNFSNYSAGIYFYRLKTKGLLPTCGKLIKNQ